MKLINRDEVQNKIKSKTDEEMLVILNIVHELAMQEANRASLNASRVTTDSVWLQNYLDNSQQWVDVMGAMGILMEDYLPDEEKESL